MAKTTIYGLEKPRLFTPPLRPLNRKTSRGYEVADFADLAGEPLLPWEKWAAVHALELKPDGSYRFKIVIILVARQNGKSHLKRTVTLWRMYMEPGTQCLGVAQDVSLARKQWAMAKDTISGCPDLQAEMARNSARNGDEWFTLANGSLYGISAANAKAGRGLSIDELNVDELRTQTGWEAWGALSKTTMARPRAQTWAMSNAGDDSSVVLNHLREIALGGSDDSIGIFEWSGEDGCELDDMHAIRQANPGLGHIISLQSIMTSLSTDPPDIFRTEVLCQRVDQLDGAVDLTAWRDCADASGGFDLPMRRKLSVCFDVAPDGKHATLVAAALMKDGRVRVELVKAWDGAVRRDDLQSLLDTLKPKALIWYPSGPAAAFAPIMAKYAQARTLNGMDVAAACQGLADLAKARQIVQPGDPLMDSHIGGAQKLPAGDGWRFTRRGGGHVDAAYAAAGAIHGALTMPVAGPVRLRWIS